MKRILKINQLSSLALLSLSSAVLCEAATIIDFGDSLASAPPTGLGDTSGFRDSIVFWNTGTQSAGDLVFTGVAGTDSTTGISFTFDLTVSNGTGVPQVGASNAINGSLGEALGIGLAVNTFEDGDTITVAVSNVTPDDPSGGAVSFDGFVNFGTDNSGTGEGFNVNGIDYIRGTATNGDSDPRQGISLPTGGAVSAIATRLGNVASPLLVQNSVDISFIGASTSLRGVSLEFSSAVIPEPSSTLLIGLGSLSLLARRKRK